MYELTVDTHFDAAHSLRNYPGECARLHGHTWGVAVSVQAEILSELGLSIDFKTIASVLNDIVRRFDHKTLNDMEEFSELNPTAENLACLLFELISEKINNKTIRVCSVTVTEGERYHVTYKKEEK